MDQSVEYNFGIDTFPTKQSFIFNAWGRNPGCSSVPTVLFDLLSLQTSAQLYFIWNVQVGDDRGLIALR